MIRSANKRHAKNWSKAQASMPTLKGFAGDTATVEFWKLVKESLYLPIHRETTSEILSHDLQVAQAVLAKARLADNDLVAWDTLETYLKRNLVKPKPDTMDSVLAQNLANLIDAQIKSTTRAAPPPLPAAA